MTGRILVVSEESLEAANLCARLAAKGHTIVRADSSALDDQGADSNDLVLTLGPQAVEVCELLRRRDPKSSIIVVDAAPSMLRAVAALRAGATDFMTNPDDTGALDSAIERVLEKRLLSERLGRLSSGSEESDPSHGEFLGESVAMRLVRSRIHRLKGSDATVLVTGECGTGKTATARMVHEQSPNRGGPFVTIPCSTISVLPPYPPGTTLFFDHVERLAPSAQAMLESLLERRAGRAPRQGTELPINTRIIASSRVDLTEEMAAGRFREGLFSLLSAVEIHLPPLRERGLDALLLAQHFVRHFATASRKRVVGMTLGAARALMEQDWPDNVRELSNRIEAAVTRARHDHITESELLGGAAAPDRGGSSPGDDTLVTWNSLEARHIAAILEEAGGNKARAARLLGIDRKTLYRKLERYGLDAPERLRRAH